MIDELTVCRGGCHCGAVRFEIDLPARVQAFHCNCSICRACGFLHVFVARKQFRLLAGADELTEYRFHTRTAKHLFCRICGIKSFYVPRSHPDGFSINLNCLELSERIEVQMGEFDGRHWSRSIAALQSQTDERHPR